MKCPDLSVILAVMWEFGGKNIRGQKLRRVSSAHHSKVVREGKGWSYS